MALPSDFDLWEARYVDHGGTFPTGFTAANDAAWAAGTANKLRIHDLDLSELKLASIPDNSLQTGFHGRSAPIVTLSGGAETMAIKFKQWLPGGSSTQSAEDVATLMGLVMGGITSPATAISDLAEALSSTTNIVANAHGQVAGQAVLVGALGDGYADGKPAIIKTANANDYDLMMALPGIPQVGDVVKHGHSLWVKETDQSYQSFLFIGAYAGSGAADQPVLLNVIGCSGTLAFGGLAPGEMPWVEYTYNIADWRVEPYATTSAFSHTQAVLGDDPAGDRGIGAMTIGDTASTTRTTVQGGDVEFNLNMELVPILDPQGLNGIGGWKKVRGDQGPTMACTAYWGDMPGRRNDFTGGTAKQLLFACGHATEATVVFAMNQAKYIEDPAPPMEYQRMLGERLVFEGDKGDATDLSTDAYRLEDAPVVITLL